MKTFNFMPNQAKDLLAALWQPLLKFSLIPILVIFVSTLSQISLSHAGESSLPSAPSVSEAQTALTEMSQTYSTYLGGSNDDRVRAATVDADGNIYLTGSTYSTDFPGPNGKVGSDEDVFVMRLNPQGTAVVWTTYIGGGNSEAGHALALDGQGGLWITGYTSSHDFPVSPGNDGFAGYDDIIAVKLNTADGTPQYSAVYGGENLDRGNGIAISPTTDQVYITGEISDEFNRSNVLIMALDGQSHAVQTIAYFGRERGRDVGHAIALDAADNIYITGQTEPSGQDTDFPLTDNPFQAECGLAGSHGECSQDAFLTIIAPDVSQIFYSSYIGGSYNNDPNGYSNDVGTGVAVSTDGSVYLTGYTFASDFPVASAMQPTKLGANNFTDGYVMRLDPAANELLFSTYLGGDGWDEGHALTIDEQGNVYVVGMTNSLNFPTLNAPQPTFGSGSCFNRLCYDAFATKLTASGMLVWSSYLGGALDDIAYGLTRSKTGELFLVGETESFSFPTSNNALQPNKSFFRDGFLTRFGKGVDIPPTPAPYQIYLPLTVK